MWRAQPTAGPDVAATEQEGGSLARAFDPRGLPRGAGRHGHRGRRLATRPQALPVLTPPVQTPATVTISDARARGLPRPDRPLPQQPARRPPALPPPPGSQQGWEPEQGGGRAGGSRALCSARGPITAAPGAGRSSQPRKAPVPASCGPGALGLAGGAGRPEPSPGLQCLQAWAAGKGKVTSLLPGICCLEASPWRPEGSGWVKIANPRGCKFQEAVSERKGSRARFWRGRRPGWESGGRGRGVSGSATIRSPPVPATRELCPWAGCGDCDRLPAGDVWSKGFLQAGRRGQRGGCSVTSVRSRRKAASRPPLASAWLAGAWGLHPHPLAWS